MYKKIRTLFVVSIAMGILFTPFNLPAKPQYVNWVPNGTKFKCLTCHINPAGGGSHNDFGIDFREARGKWSQILANLDSDGDGYSNGQELLDSTGTWRKGNRLPGRAYFVSLPGNASSIPKPKKLGQDILASVYLFPYYFKRLWAPVFFAAYAIAILVAG